jgi:hypothetical protein
MVAVAALALVALAGAAMLAFGADVFARYLTAQPWSRYPAYVYTQTVVQSLSATILRAMGRAGATTHPLSEPAVMVPTLIVLLVTALAVWRARTEREAWALALLLSAAFMVFPATLHHYHLVLLAPMLLLWAERDEFPGGAAAAGLVIVATYALCIVPPGRFVFWAFALQWTVALALCVRAPVPRPAP